MFNFLIGNLEYYKYHCQLIWYIFVCNEKCVQCSYYL